MGINSDTARSWVNDNIFSFRKGDGAAYLFFYIVIPVAITWISLTTFPNNSVAAIHCYVTILVSALNCIYDAGNRWVAGKKSLRNTKLFLVILSSAVIVAYCTVVIINMSMTENIASRCDYLLLIYIVAIIVTLTDVVGCFLAEMAWISCID